MGPLKYFLGIEVARSLEGLFLYQRKYALDVLIETGMLGAKPCSCPMEQNTSLTNDSGVALVDASQYRRLIRCLLYLIITKPDIMYSVHILNQFMQDPRQGHWGAAIRIPRCLKSSPEQRILLPSGNPLDLHVYCNFDWASCPMTRRSITGYLVKMGKAPIAWKTKKQVMVSRSSAEVEYRAMANATSELVWIRNHLLLLGFPVSFARLYCDNQAALHIANNPVFHERTKHIEVDCHFVRERIRSGVLTPEYTPTHEQIADIFYQSLDQRQFHYLLGKLGVSHPYAPT